MATSLPPGYPAHPMNQILRVSRLPAALLYLVALAGVPGLHWLEHARLGSPGSAPTGVCSSTGHALAHGSGRGQGSRCHHPHHRHPPVAPRVDARVSCVDDGCQDPQHHHRESHPTHHGPQCPHCSLAVAKLAALAPSGDSLPHFLVDLIERHFVAETSFVQGLTQARPRARAPPRA